MRQLLESSYPNHKNEPLDVLREKLQKLFYLNIIKCFKVAYQLKQYRCEVNLLWHVKR